MALRNIVCRGDELLGKKCRPVSSISERILGHSDDMRETMRAQEVSASPRHRWAFCAGCSL